MKKKLLLYLSPANQPENIPVASTLAWLCRSKNHLFDNYFHSYHLGGHFPGGDARELAEGELTGGTVSGDRHFEEFYFLLLSFDVSAVCWKESLFLPSIKNLNIPVKAFSDRIDALYQEVFDRFSLHLPSQFVMIGSGFGKSLTGLEAYVYPEIYYRQGLGIPDSISEGELKTLWQEGSKISCFYVDQKVVDRLRQKGYEVEVVDQVQKNDDYSSITQRIGERWKKRAQGWILGDPMLVSHWLPKACEENLIAVYGVPQEKIISGFKDALSSRGKVVYGRQSSDKDFFDLSKMNQCLQVIDPCRPPFQSVRHIPYVWPSDKNREGFYGQEYSDEELRQFAREGRILVSLMFWSGMIREIANLYNLMDLFAITRLKCGLVLTAQSFEYMMHSPLELLTVPVEQGGVYPLVEPVLGSCGVGVGIESFMTAERLEQNLKEALSRIEQKVRQENYLPRGWWATMDSSLERSGWRKRPKPFRFFTHSPYFQIRFKARKRSFPQSIRPVQGKSAKALRDYTEKIKEGLKKSGWRKYFSPYRPYEFYGPGPVREEIVQAVKSAGLGYMFSKSGFRASPEVQYMDHDFIALNYTAGRWDGWTPFETINHVSDLRRAEKSLLRRKKPGWIVSTIDSCLWTFGGEFWKRGNELYQMALFCAQGGHSKKLINVKPYTIARYARIIK
ncbi:MAG: hypothetical protein ACLFVG_04785 [Candidatus Aminicenantes bacterium]